MERIIRLQIELQPEGVYLGTSDDVPGLVVEADTIAEVLEVARDLSPRLLELAGLTSSPTRRIEQVELPLVIAA